VSLVRAAFLRLHPTGSLGAVYLAHDVTRSLPPPGSSSQYGADGSLPMQSARRYAFSCDSVAAYHLRGIPVCRGASPGATPRQ
jgi:hypothetical protein